MALCSNIGPCLNTYFTETPTVPPSTCSLSRSHPADSARQMDGIMRPCWLPSYNRLGMQAFQRCWHGYGTCIHWNFQTCDGSLLTAFIVRPYWDPQYPVMRKIWVPQCWRTRCALKTQHFRLSCVHKFFYLSPNILSSFHWISHWADSVIELRYPSVCLCVCVCDFAP